MIRIAAVAAVLPLLAVADPAAAAGRTLERVCVVADPSGTPLNIRDTPDGRIVGSIVNGSWVYATSVAHARGKPWVYVHDSDRRGTPGEELGWVYLDYLNCR